MLTTAFYLTADWKSGALRYANAGHPKPLLAKRSSSQVAPLVNACGKSQPALGLFEDAIYETSSAKLAPGDLVILFTDGLYEVHNPANEIYTPALLAEGVQKRAQLSAPRLFDGLLEEIRAFSGGTGFSDDVCLVGVELAG
jgi:sigma-B regulation protein RsbU (phosphoserine phosphatase)